MIRPECLSLSHDSKRGIYSRALPVGHTCSDRVSVLLKERRVQLVARKGQKPLVSSKSIRAFRDDYICLEEISSIVGRGRNVVRRRLKSLKMSPDKHLAKHRLRYYPRDVFRAREKDLRTPLP